MSRITNTAVATLIELCDKLQQVTIGTRGYMHSSCRCFDACMRAFDTDRLPAEAITFRVYFNVPVMKKGFARIHNDGTMQMWTGDDPHED